MLFHDDKDKHNLSAGLNEMKLSIHYPLPDVTGTNRTRLRLFYAISHFFLRSNVNPETLSDRLQPSDISVRP